ncbi:MAG: prepilin peptidase [Gammaproteobacteria bacterium]|nr:prepilin peptidase [Gammaproteobacteria bacterium]
MTWLIITYSILIGLIIGSFLNVVIYRLPIMLNLAYPPSHCPKCQTKIKPWHNIPIISYLILRGKCAKCKQPISIRYPLVEALTAFLTLIIINHLGLNIIGLTATLLTYSLIAMSVIDIDYQILPDELTLSMLWIGLLLNSFNVFTTPQAAILGAIIGYSFLFIIAKTFKLIRGIDGMGNGDFKLLAMFGAWLGWQQLPFIILASSIIGIIISLILIIFRKHKVSEPIPFGPYIAIAGFIAMLWGKPILIYYLRFIGI